MTGLRGMMTAITVMLLATGLWAQEHQHGETGPMQKQMGKEMMGKKGMMDMCMAMMSGKQDMKAQMATQDARLQEKLKAMNAAKGNKKVDAMAEVIQELVAQRKEMHGMMMGGMQGMMGHMMDHMKSGMSMSECPMMKGMMTHGEDSEKAESEDHSAHH